MITNIEPLENCTNTHEIVSAIDKMVTDFINLHHVSPRQLLIAQGKWKLIEQLKNECAWICSEKLSRHKTNTHYRNPLKCMGMRVYKTTRTSHVK